MLRRMARILLVGGGDRALRLATALRAEGHAVRAAEPDASRRAEIEATGAEYWPGDPDVVGTLRYAVDNVTVLLWLLGDRSEPELHGSRWRMMLERTIDTTVRGVVYEAGPPEGELLTREMAELNEIPHRVIRVSDPDWHASARAAIDALLESR